MAMMRTTGLFTVLLALGAPALFTALPVAAAPRALTMDERMALRCGAAFAMVANGQAKGDPAMSGYPPLAVRGREFFVRLSAQLMDAAGLDEAGLKAAAEGEALALRRQRGLEGTMPFCLRVLDAQPGLPAR